MAIKLIHILTAILLSGLYTMAQKVIYLRPAFGLHSPLSELSQNDYKQFVTLRNNNKIWLTLKYEIGVELVLNKKSSVLVTYSNGNAGLSMGVEHTKPCVPGGSPPNPRGSDRYEASGYNNKRLILGLRNNFKYKPKTNGIRHSLELGIGLDFKSNENDSGRLVLPGVNQCGEEFYLEPLPNTRKSVGLLLPIQFNLEWLHRDKPSVMVSLFYHFGLTKQFTQQINYVTNSYTDKSFFNVKGTSWGFKISIPIKLVQLFNKQ